MDRTLGWGYPMGMGILLALLLFIIGIWKVTGEHMNVEGHMTRKAEGVLLGHHPCKQHFGYSFGYSFGDFMSESLDLGFGISASILGSLLAICAVLAYFTKLSHVVLFWIAFILSRPFGATFGDLLTKSKEEGGLDLGTLEASMTILGVFCLFLFH
jgi:uncharacterized membrane-anchored protein